MLTGLAALLLVATAGVVAWSFTLPEDDLAVVEPGDLEVAEAAHGRWALGPLEVALSGDGLVVREGGRTVWENPLDRAFLSAARGSVAVEQHRGHFWPEVTHGATWTEQRVDRVEATASRVRLSGTLSGGGEGKGVAWSATFRARPGGGALLTAEVPDARAVALSSGRSPDTGVHGFGEQFTDFDLDDRVLPIIVREQGVGRGEQPLSLVADLTDRSAAGEETATYAAVASWVTDDLRGVRLAADRPESHAFAVADTRDDERVTLEVWAPRLEAELTAADSPAELVAGRHVGAPSLPAWTQGGAVVGLSGGSETVRRRVADLQASGVELAGVWLRDWTGPRDDDAGGRTRWTWQLDRQHYPGWERLVADLGRQGIRVTTYVNPFLVDTRDDPDLRDLYAEARDAGHLVRRPDGSPYLLDQGGLDAALVDLSDPGARTWYARVIAEEVLGVGAAGFTADLGDGLPLDAVIARGDAREAHNRWPALWAQTVREACEEAGRPDCLTWFRSGSLGIGRDASLLWTGDQLVDFGRDDGMASALLGTFSAGVSGWPLVHSDLGGSTSVDTVLADYGRDPRLLQRWAELAAFGVVMRTAEGDRPGADVQVYDEEQRPGFARMTRVFAALAPYRREVLAEARDRGLPAIRHGWLVAPGTPAAEVDTQFFLGDAVLVAPVLERTGGGVEVTFPPGRWLSLVTGRTYEEGTVEVEALPGRPAAFVRADHPLAEQLVREVSEAVS